MPTLLDDGALAALHEDFASTGDLDELAKLIGGFLERGEEQVGAVAKAVAGGDLASAGAAAHKLGGASRTLGASLVGAVAGRIEDAARARDEGAARRTVPELEAVFSLSRAALLDAVDAFGGGAETASPAARSGGDRLRALLVDDDPIALALLRAVVERLGHEAVVATGGEQALEELATTRPDVVVADLHMPGIDGLELARLIRGQAAVAPLVVVLGASSGCIDDPAVDAALSKPVREDELARVLARATARGRGA